MRLFLTIVVVALALRAQAAEPTPDNFGVLGERPTHPELLDWFAMRFVSTEIGWSRKN